MAYEKPLPIINEDNAAYWEYAREHELRMQKCASCGHIRFPVSLVCPRCHAVEAEWARLSGRGKVYSYIIYRQAYHPSYQDDIPYAVAIIQLEEGPRLESNLTDCRLDDIKIGMPVRLYFDDVTEEISLPKFRPAVGG